MGAFHEGHISLIRLARSRCETVVVSLFVNPSQFDEHADLERYPRDERRDVELAAAAGADVLFTPSVAEMYPPGFATAVEVINRVRKMYPRHFQWKQPPYEYESKRLPIEVLIGGPVESVFTD